MRALNGGLWPAALALETVAAWMLFAGGGVTPAPAAGAHLLAALLAAAGTYSWLPARYRQPRGWALACLFSVAASIPVLGMLGLLVGLLPALRLPRHAGEDDWEAQPHPELPFKPVEVDPEAVYLRGGLAAVLLHFDDPAWRLRAVMATRRLDDRRAIPILRNALKDPADQVRLLAYSLLNGKQRRLDAAIRQLRRQAPAAPAAAADDVRGVRDEQMAALYLEQAELGLVDGEVRQYVLQQAFECIERALEAGDRAPRRFLRGRINLGLERLDAADADFEAAETLGFSADKAAPYRAEIAFKRYDFEQVCGQLRRLGAQARRVPLLTALVEYWL
ncbi:MAG: HEAT repeat domain-containing protein [Gammaproteobacteria bacterium]|nr:HEAT repeat domain-containing protein [Gammaproteobacteria bacterium]